MHTIVYLLFVQLMQKGHKLVIEQMVTTLSVVADSSEELFLPYYDQFMPSLKFILANANEKKYRLLRGKTMECISFIGLAVGKEKVRAVSARSCDRIWWSHECHVM